MLGVAAFAGLGFGAAALIRSAEGVSAVVNVVILPMAFLSGSFGPTADFPRALQAIADVLPLTYFLDIVYRVYLDGESLFADPKALGIVVAWGVAGFAVARAASAGCRASGDRQAVVQQREEVGLGNSGEGAGDVRPGGCVQRRLHAVGLLEAGRDPGAVAARSRRSNSTGSVTNWNSTATAYRAMAR